MIPSPGCDPKINVLVVGAEILKLLKNESMYSDTIIALITNKLSISIDHAIISLDWLYSIKAINFKNNKVSIGETP